MYTYYDRRRENSHNCTKYFVMPSEGSEKKKRKITMAAFFDFSLRS